MEHFVLGHLYGLLDGRTHHRWLHGAVRRMAKLLVAQRSYGHLCSGLHRFTLPRDKVNKHLTLTEIRANMTRWHRIHPDEMTRDTVLSSDQSGEKSFGHSNMLQKTTSNDPANTGNTEPAHTELALAETNQRDPHLGKGKPTMAQFRLFQANENPVKSILLDLWIPWKMFAFPIVEFASFVVSWSCSAFLTINLTQSQVFAAPPYNFSSQTIGFTNFAILVGAFIGLATGGPFSDWVAAKLTVRNNGVREPEMRLVAMIPYVIIMYVGNIVISVGYEKKWPWEAIVLVGYTFVGIQVSALPAISSTYAVDSYKPVAGSIFVSITVNKNVWGYGFSKFITPWSLEAG